MKESSLPGRQAAQVAPSLLSFDTHCIYSLGFIAAIRLRPAIWAVHLDTMTAQMSWAGPAVFL